jgi:hypothetical protein
MSNNLNNKFINPLCSVNNIDCRVYNNEVDKQEFYNCFNVDEWSGNKWTCYGPYLNHEDAIALKGVYDIPKYHKSMLVPVSNYFPHRIDIMKTLVGYTFPEVAIRSFVIQESKEEMQSSLKNK